MIQIIEVPDTPIITIMIMIMITLIITLTLTTIPIHTITLILIIIMMVDMGTTMIIIIMGTIMTICKEEKIKGVTTWEIINLA